MNTTIVQHSVTELDEICIVDDSYVPRLVTQKLCESYFGEVPVKVFEGVDEAVSHLQHGNPKKRIIFLDLHMPDKDGWSFLDHYQPAPEERIFILSSSEGADDRGRAAHYQQVEDFISKPITQNKLVEIASALRSR